MEAEDGWVRETLATKPQNLKFTLKLERIKCNQTGILERLEGNIDQEGGSRGRGAI